MLARSLMLAAGEVPDFMPGLAAIVVTGAAAAWVCQRIGLVPIVGFLVAGVLIGPESLGLVDRAESVEAAAEIGVILLLFTIGIEFSLERLAQVRRLVLGGGTLAVLLAIGVTTVVVLATGGGLEPAIYTGLLVSVSSTAVVLSLLAARRETATPTGQLTVAVLIFEDLAVVAMVLLVPMLGEEGGSIGEALGAVGIAVAVVAGVLVVARRLMPRLLEAVARVCSPEVFLLSVIAICFATAYLTSLAGVSVSLGAFLAGLVVSESRFSAQALGEVAPLQIVFTATFFVSVGMLLDPGFLVEEPVLVVAVVLGVAVIKTVTGTVAGLLVGVAVPVALASALLRTQIGEFSFVLEQVGRDEGLTPGDLDEHGVQAFLAASVLLMVATPGFAVIGSRAADVLRRRSASRPGAGAAGGDGLAGLGEVRGTDPAELTDHVIVAGYGPAGHTLVPALRRAAIPFVIVTLNPHGADHADGIGAPVVLGDRMRRQTLEEVGLHRARMVVVADDDAEAAARIAALVRSLSPGVAIVVRAADDDAAAALARAGADSVVTGARASAKWLAHTVLRRYERESLFATDRLGPTIDTDRIVRFDPAPGACAHLGSVRPVLPSSAGCQECLQLGEPWVHLRICMTCGHVGCCDDSPGRHARAHAVDPAHPIARSMEPGETWGWCFVDDLEL